MHGMGKFRRAAFPGIGDVKHHAARPARCIWEKINHYNRPLTLVIF